MSGEVEGDSDGPTTPPRSTLPVTGFSVLPLVTVCVLRGRGEEVRRGVGEGVALRVGVGLGVGLAVGSAVGVGVAVGRGLRQVGSVRGEHGVGLAATCGVAPAVPGVARASRGSSTTAAAASAARRREVVGTARW